MDSPTVNAPLLPLPIRNRRRASRITVLLELLMGIWATYSCVRYLLSFLRQKSILGLSLALLSATSILLVALSIFISRLGKHARLLLCLRFLSALFWLSPAIINLVLAFVWKSSSDPELSLQARCHLDVDVVWSISQKSTCPIEPISWSLWLVLSLIRFVLTVSLVAIHTTASFFTFLSLTRCSHRHSRWLNSSSGINEPSQRADHHPSDSTLDATLNVSSPRAALSSHLRPRSFDDAASDLYYNSKTMTNEESDAGFVDKFRSLISQITREMEDTLEAARSHSPSNNNNNRPYAPLSKPYDDHDHYAYNHNDMFGPPPVLGYNEFGMPYPPEENIHFLGGYVKRMPTIESIGSGEMSSAGSRLPSRRTTISTSGHDRMRGDSPMGSNHAAAAAALPDKKMFSNSLSSPVSSISEHGELVVPLLSRMASSTTTSSSSSSSHHQRRSVPSSFRGGNGTVIINNNNADSWSSSDTRATYHTAATAAASAAGSSSSSR